MSWERGGGTKRRRKKKLRKVLLEVSTHVEKTPGGETVTERWWRKGSH